MADSLTLYRTIMAFVWESGLRLHDLRCVYTLVWALVGLLLSHQIHLARWALYRPGPAQAASKQRQLSRWLHNAQIVPAAVYRRLIQVAVRDWVGERMYLALDSTTRWGRFTIVRLALVYRGRAVPLSWVVLAHSSASVAFVDYQVVLEQAAAVLPPGSRPGLLADRAFGDYRLWQAVRDLGWHFRIRLKGSVWVYRANHTRTKVGRLWPPKGEALFLHAVWLTKRRYGPLSVALAQVRTAHGYERWAILSDEPTALHTFDEYGWRFDLEENFLDDKSAGFQLEASEIWDAAALSRLALILATATLYLVSTGTAVVATGHRREVDAHWQRGLSYFQIGWRWLHHALTHGKRLLAFLWLEPEPDPAPVFASKRQAAQPVASLSALHLET